MSFIFKYEKYLVILCLLFLALVFSYKGTFNLDGYIAALVTYMVLKVA